MTESTIRPGNETSFSEKEEVFLSAERGTVYVIEEITRAGRLKIRAKKGGLSRSVRPVDCERVRGYNEL